MVGLLTSLHCMDYQYKRPVVVSEAALVKKGRKTWKVKRTKERV